MLSLMDNNDMALHLAGRAKALRLGANFSQKTLAARSGVSEGSIKRFERSGEIALASLLKISVALGCLENFEPVFAPKATPSLAQLTKPQRARGRG